MSAEQLVESFNCLITKLSFANGNVQTCKELKRKYRSVIASDNLKKKEELATIIRSSITPLYNSNRDDIMSKDFSFLVAAEKNEDGKLIPSNNTLIIDNHDIGAMYLAALDDDDDENLRLVVNELLFLFYQIAPEQDQKLIDSKYKKAKPVSTTPNPLTAAQNVQPNLAKQMEKMLQKNKDKLKKAEKDPSVIPDVLADFFKNNSKDMAGMLQGMLGTMGIDPSQMSGGK